MSASYNKFRAIVEYMAEGVVNLQSDALKIALCATANAPVATNSVLGDLTEIDYTNLSSRTLTVSASAQSGGVYKNVVNDLVLTASGGDVAAFQYIVVYDDTPTSPADPLIAWFDYGSALTLHDGESLTLDFDGTNGFFQLS